MKTALLFLSLSLFCCTATQSQSYDLTLETLLEEMVSFESGTCFPDYVCLQQSSHDRRSVSPGNTNWFANDDGYGIIRSENREGRTEKVLFETGEPGVITRIWITTLDRRGTLRFYFDGSDLPGWTVPAYDLLQFGIPLGNGLCQPHINNVTGGKGGSTFYLPIPYGQSCKVTLEEPEPSFSTPRYYHFNYRKYPAAKSIETFSQAVAARAASTIQRVNDWLLHPPAFSGGIPVSNSKTVSPGEEISISLPEGGKAVKNLQITVRNGDEALYPQLLRCLIVKAEFDGYETVWAPLSDFSGGGMGAPPVESYFLSAGGNGNISCRFPMPYQNTGKITVLNCFNREADIVLQAHADDYEWKTSSLYFHASWRQETEIPVTNRWENCRDWNFATLQGKGVFKGDVLTLFNHTTSWYGEGDEKIYVDGEAFPSHFGTGTEDYYNCSWAPVSPFHTPFGGAPRADYDSSTGYNTFLRLRCLDGIPFESRLQFDIEMLSWTEGTVDYATTVFWYGEGSAIATGASGVEEATRELLPSPENPLNYTIPNSLEFEDLIPAEQSPSLATEIQDMTVFSGFKWSKAKQLLCRNASQGDYLLYRFENYKPVTYRIQVQGTKAVDYGILSFSVNGNPLINADLYHNSVVHSGIISLGEYTPENGCFEIKIIYSGKSRSATGNLFGLDCIQFIEADFKVANAIELEGYAHASVEGLSSHFAQNMDAYRNGKWSERHQKVYTAFVRGNSVDFLFPHWGSDSCSLTLYATRGPDFGILSFQVNGEALHLKYDCYHDLVSDTGPVKLGRFLPQADGSIHLRINVTGTNPFSAHPKYIVGLDCILIEKHTPESLTDQKAGPPSYRILDKTLYIHSTDRVNETILFNLLGMQVLKTQDSRLDISSLAKGVYIVLFNFGETKLTEKIHIN